MVAPAAVWVVGAAAVGALAGFALMLVVLFL